jgi:esterase/lipase superfamily enzyme
MHRDHHRWYSHRLNRDMGVAVYGNYGMPMLAFPTSMGDEHEQEGQGMIRTLGPYIDDGRIRVFCINGVQSDSFNNKGAHPFHRSTGAWEVPGPNYQMSAVLATRGIAHHLDDWGPKGGHEWPYWHHQMWEYMGAHF